MSGVFAVTFSVIFAYVADITQEHERSTAYGLVRKCPATAHKFISLIEHRAGQTAKTSSPAVRLFPGVGDLCCQPGHQPGHRSLLVCCLRRHPGGDPGHRHLPARHLLHPGGRARVAAREDEAGIVGSAHLLGTGGPLRRELVT